MGFMAKPPFFLSLYAPVVLKSMESSGQAPAVASDGILQLKEPFLPPYRGPTEEDFCLRTHMDYFLTLDYLFDVHPDQLMLLVNQL